MSNVNRRLEIFSFIGGLVFLLSGIAKSFDSGYFASIINSYGFGHLQFLAPIIIIIELVIGLSLMFHVGLKYASAIGAIIIVIFTVLYVYAYLFKGINDCGCFGKWTILNTNPYIVIGKNVILLIVLSILWVESENNFRMPYWIAGLCMGFLCLFSFITGNTYKTSEFNGILKGEKDKLDIIKRYVNISSDSTYVVFVFSYSCPHCLNSIANLSEYEQLEIVDEVYGLALGNPNEESIFKEYFNPQFEVINCTPDIFSITKDFPKTYFISNNEILIEMSGEIPCAYVFEAQLLPKI